MEFPHSLIESSGIIEKISSYFSQARLAELARQTRFVERRTSQVSGQMFLMLNVLAGLNPKSSLNELSEWLDDEFGVKLRKQSLDERFNTYAVAFMRTSLQQAFTHWLPTQLPAQVQQSGFSRILLTDATSWQLPAHLASFYPSNGGSTTGASIKLHYSFDLLQGKVEELLITAGRDNDAHDYRQSKLEVEANDLVIRDLGYFKADHWLSIAQKGAYFLSRLKSDTSVYSQTDTGYQALELATLLPAAGKSVAYPQLYITAKKLAVRLLIEAVPEELGQQRLEKLRAQARNQHWQLSPEREKLCGYNLFITNASAEQLPDSLLRICYYLRCGSPPGQIELVFKSWKSLLELDQVKPMSIFRFECMLYGKLIAVVLSGQLQALFKGYWWNIGDFELSEWKAVKQLKKSSAT
jgi:hypothetical protein